MAMDLGIWRWGWGTVLEPFPVDIVYDCLQKYLTLLAVQWLRLHASTAEDTGSSPGRGNRILRATQHGQ